MDQVEFLIGEFGGKLVANRRVKRIIVETLLLLPPDTVEYLVDHCWFLSSAEDAWAFAFHGDDISGQHLIFLSDELFLQDLDQIQYTILHEVGHVVLKHRNAIDYDQSKEEIAGQEKEADMFAKKYLRSPN